MVWQLRWAGGCAAGAVRAGLPGHMVLLWVCGSPCIQPLAQPPGFPVLFKDAGSITG